jgi:acetylornithine deacetylase/succinyl-diaminopimelate desuccinylase-like protein
MITDEQTVSIFRDMIRLDTTNPDGNEVLMTDYMAKILDDRGIPHTIVESSPNRTNIIASIGPDNGKRPILLISHTDVVTCENQSWKHPPFDAVEDDGYIYGRGTLDTKHLTAMQLVAFLNTDPKILKRRVYFIATADEEKGSTYGMPEVVKRFHREFANALVINEGGGFAIKNREVTYFLCTVGEKGRCDVHVNLDGDSGPASFKNDNKVVDKFSHLLERLSTYEFPLEDNSVHRRFMELLGGDIENPVLQNFARYNGHDACILHRYDIGKQVNVLPYHVEFDFSLQLLPGRTQEHAERMLKEIFNGVDASYTITDFTAGFASSCDNSFFKCMETLVGEHYGNARLLPVYALGRTDGRFLGPLPCDVYGFSPVTDRIQFEEVLTLVHQTDERIDRDSIIIGTRYFTDLITRMGGDDRD